MTREEMAGGTVWIVEDDRALGTLLVEEVRDAGLDGYWKSSAEEAVQAMDTQWPDLIVCDLRLPGMDGLTFLKKIISTVPDTPPGFLIITAFGTIPKAVEALKAGADDFLTKPLDLEHFMLRVTRILEKNRLRDMVSQMRGLLKSDSFHDMYGNSRVMCLLFEQIRQVAKASGPVLITGESGTGKELVARAIHMESARAEGPFLPVNCAGVPAHLLESEFFGHAEGAFTGARSHRNGLFDEAQGGSLLLDEISEMPVSLQAKLLRILQDGRLRRVGENREHSVDVRVLAATHRDMDKAVKSQSFREDLFFRLEAFTLQVPPLRERGDDIELLAARFMQQFALGLGKTVKGFSSRAMALLCQYPFPGNVRELSNAVERAVTFTTQSQIRAAHLPARIRKFQSDSLLNDALSPVSKTVRSDEPLLSLAQVEARYIHHVLKKTDGNKRKAASILGIGRRTLYRRLEESLRFSQDNAGNAETGVSTSS